MSENAKNRLQIYCQQSGLNLPKYTQTIDNVTKMWHSAVSVPERNVMVYGEPHVRKVQADISAAEKACEILFVTDVEVVVVPKFGIFDLMLPVDGDMDPVYVLVDYENVNRLDYLSFQYINGNNHPVYVCKFVGYCNQKACTAEPSHVILSPGSDAVDHYISFYLGMLVNTLLHRSRTFTVIILTRDTFAAHHTHLKHGGLSVLHSVTEKQCVEKLEALGYRKTKRLVEYI